MYPPRIGPITDETGMATYIKQYKGVCGNCGKYGHRRRNCPQNERNSFKFQVGNNKPGATCYYCGEQGQYTRDFKVKKKAEMIKGLKGLKQKSLETLRLTRSTNLRMMKASGRLDFIRKGF